MVVQENSSLPLVLYDLPQIYSYRKIWGKEPQLEIKISFQSSLALQVRP
jgi:hypothetical protein